MAKIVGRDESRGVDALAQAGVEFHRATLVDDAYVTPADVVAAVLPEGCRDVREEVRAVVPEGDMRDHGMGAWHINDAFEVHTILSGEGILEFVTPEGIVSVLGTAGDIMVVRGVEHRYLPLTDQIWQIRTSAEPGTAMTARETGRDSLPWPTV